MNVHCRTTTRRLAVVGLLAVLGWAGTAAQGYCQTPAVQMTIHVGQTEYVSLPPHGNTTVYIQVTPGTGNVRASAGPNGTLAVTGVAKGTASVTVQGLEINNRPPPLPPLRHPFIVTFYFRVD